MNIRRTVTILGAVVCFAAWIAVGFVVPVGAGWPHVLLAIAVVLLIFGVAAGDAKDRGTTP